VLFLVVVELEESEPEDAAVDFRAGAFFAVVVFDVDEEGLDFFAVDLVAVDFDAVDLEAVDFDAVDFVGVDFVAVDFFAADLVAVDFFAADLVAVDLAGVDFAGVDFDAVDFAGLDFLAADLLAVVLLALVLAALVFAALVLDAVVLAALVFAALVFVAVGLVPPVCLAVPFFAAATAEPARLATSEALGSFGSFLAPETTAFSSAPAVNFGTAVFLALIRSPVRGLRTHRASRTRFSNDPKPVIANFSPRATSRVIVSSTDSSACCACLRFPSKRVDRVSIN
jgi:hypothetical protein